MATNQPTTSGNEQQPDDTKSELIVTRHADKEAFTAFLSMPHEFDDLRHEIIAALDALPDFTVHCEYVTRSAGRELREEVTDKLRACDFIIGDVSSRPDHPQGPRPNIMWELGYAWHMGLDRIIIVNESETKNVGSLIIDQHYIPYNPNRRVDMLRELSHTVVEVCNRATLKRTAQRSETSYTATVYIDRIETNMPAWIRDARRNIRILETNLSSIVRDHGQHLVAALRDLRRPNLTVQVCALNPHSQFARARAIQLASLPREYETELTTALHDMQRLLSQCDPERWELRIYDTFPTQITFTFDDDVLSSVMSLGKRSRELLHFEVSTANRNASDTFRAHFNQLWSLSDTYDEWLRKENATTGRPVIRPA